MSYSPVVLQQKQHSLNMEYSTNISSIFINMHQMSQISITWKVHTVMVVAAMQGADQHISFGFNFLPKDTSTWRPG